MSIIGWNWFACVNNVNKPILNVLNTYLFVCLCDSTRVVCLFLSCERNTYVPWANENCTVSCTVKQRTKAIVKQSTHDIDESEKPSDTKLNDASKGTHCTTCEIIQILKFLDKKSAFRFSALHPLANTSIYRYIFKYFLQQKWLNSCSGSVVSRSMVDKFHLHLMPNLCLDCL